jgi:hypothetical protein
MIPVSDLPASDAPTAGCPRTVLICHGDDPLNREGLARWLASFTHLAGVVVLDETRQRLWRRIRREVKRVGLFRFADVLAFRLYYRLFLRGRDRRWEEEKLAELCRQFAPLTAETRILTTHSPNTPEAEQFLHELAPTLVIARCKTLLKPAVFTIPTAGTFVMHPGICPEYRNAHGCFWALAQNDLNNVGMTLLRIDRGVDTGPVFGYFRCAFDEAADTHVTIQHRVVFDNLDAIRDRLLEVAAGKAAPLSTTGRPSREWGQPWLTAYLSWRRQAARRRKHAEHAAVS